MPKYKLTYFNVTARGEVIRFLFAMADLDYEDFRTELQSEEWANMKPTTLFGALPQLQVDDITLCQQRAIEGYIAKLTGRAGKGDLDYARCHMIADCVEDMFSNMFSNIRKAFMMGEEQKKESLTELAEKGIQEYLAKFEKMISSNAHFVGDDITWADLSLFSWLDFFYRAGLPEDALKASIEKFPKVTKLMKNVRENRKCAEMIEKRPKTKY